MKCKIPEISWHNRDPVLSIDIQPKERKNAAYRLASGGTDTHVLIWYINFSADGDDLNLELAADLTRHARAVNTVRWSPNGGLLASGDDDSMIIIWKLKEENEQLNILENTNEGDKEVWLTYKVLRGHMEDVYDLCWSPNSRCLVSGSVDNTAMIWDVHKAKSLAILSEHKGFVQGVTWDPKNQYVATLSTDRNLRIFDIQTKRVLHRIKQGTLSVPTEHELHGKRMRYFHDDTLQTFFRRLCFTPDGKFLLTPAGVTDYDGVVTPLNTTYAFSRYALRQPCLVFPCVDQYTVAVRCCPLLYNLRPYNAEKNPPVVPLPYRMIFAVATLNSVYFYDTQQSEPFALISNIHYTRLTDITWSSDGRIVVVSSTDGFCSLITFERGELGEEYANMEAVLGAALTNETPAVVKKQKKHKENEAQTPKSKKTAAEQSEAVTNLDVAGERAVLKERDNDDATKQDTNTKAAAIPVEIIIDKEILSSDEKFESPQKNRQAQPISFHRQPRTPNSTAAAVVTTKCATPESSQQQRAATTIAVRRTPRSAFSAVSAATAGAASAPEDAALATATTKDSAAEDKMLLNTNTESLTCKEDINLISEDTEEAKIILNEQNAEVSTSPAKKQTAPDHQAAAVPNPLPANPAVTKSNQKTPRRVELRTISTPKSKKKLLD